MIRAFAAMFVVYICVGCNSSTTVSSASASRASAWPSGRGTTSPSSPTTTSDGSQPEPTAGGCGLTPVYAAQTFVNLVEAGDRARYEKCEQDGFTVSVDTLRVIATHTWLLESAHLQFTPGTRQKDWMPHHNDGVVGGGFTVDVPSLPAAVDTTVESTSTADRKSGLHVTVKQSGTEFFVTNVIQYSNS